MDIFRAGSRFAKTLSASVLLLGLAACVESLSAEQQKITQEASSRCVSRVRLEMDSALADQHDIVRLLQDLELRPGPSKWALVKLAWHWWPGISCPCKA